MRSVGILPFAADDWTMEGGLFKPSPETPTLILRKPIVRNRIENPTSLFPKNPVLH